jgi:rod shape-determining protein MreC
VNSRLNVLAIAAFVVAAGVLLFFGANPQNVRRMQATFLNIISPFLRSGSNLDRRVTAFRDGMKKLNELEDEVKDLRVQNRALSAENQTLRGYEAENNRLRNAIGYSGRAPFRLIPARIVTRDASTWYNTVIIDRGTNEGLREDMPVLTEEGLVGKTSAVSKTTSIVILISDENCKVAANVEGTREQGIVKGERASSTSQPVISMNFLSKQANLESGQKVFTTGVGGVFPSGVLIGAVQTFKVRELDGYATIVPAVNLTTLEDVFVVLSENK